MRSFITRGQRGITLIEIILYIAIIVGAGVGVAVFSKKASVTAAVETEQRQIEGVVKAVEGVFATQSDFSALGTNGAAYLKDNAARSGVELVTGDGGVASLKTKLGDGRVNLAVWDVVEPDGTIVQNGGYRLAYQALPASQCSKLVTATYPVAYQVGVAHNGLEDAGATMVARRGQMLVDTGALTDACAANSPTVFLYFAPARSVTTAPIGVTPPAARCAPIHETQYTACPAGQVGTVKQERDGTCTGAGNTMVYTVWTTTDDTCAPAPAAPAMVAAPTAPDICTTTTFTNVVSCPAGQTGQIIQTRSLDSCAGTYTPWVTQSTTCAPSTVPSTCTPSTQTRTLACLPGMTGQIEQSSSSTCATPTSTPVWSAWTTYNNTCTGTGTCSPQRETGPIPCPAGEYGPYAGERERLRRCTSATMQAPSWDAWTVLSPNTTCTSCPADMTETTTQLVKRSTPCPVGEVGVHEWDAEQVSTRNVSYSCPAGTTALPAPTMSAWSAWVDTGVKLNEVNTCVPATCTGSPTDTQWLPTSTACPSGQTGTHTWEYEQSRTRVCTAGVWGAWSGWSSTGNIRNEVNTCAPIPPSPGCGTWVWNNSGYPPSWNQNTGEFIDFDDGGGTTCSAGYGCYGTISNNPFSHNAADIDAYNACVALSSVVMPKNSSGFLNFKRSTNLMSPCEEGWEDYSPSDSCSTPPPSCTGSPTETRLVPESATCPVGQSGTNTWNAEQIRSRTCTAGVWSAWSAWTYTGNTFNTVNTCKPDCNIAAGQVFNWTVSGNACSFTQPTATKVAANGSFGVTDSIAPTTGSASFACSATGVLSGTPNTGATCNAIPDPFAGKSVTCLVYGNLTATSQYFNINGTDCSNLVVDIGPPVSDADIPGFAAYNLYAVPVVNGVHSGYVVQDPSTWKFDLSATPSPNYLATGEKFTQVMFGGRTNPPSPTWISSVYGTACTIGNSTPTYSVPMSATLTYLPTGQTKTYTWTLKFKSTCSY